MNHAIAQLGIAAEVAEHNLPYSLQAGDMDQAALQQEVASDCRQAIDQLQNQESDQEH